MKKVRGERGIIKQLTLIVVGFAAILLVLAFLGQYVGPIGSITGSNTNTSPNSSFVNYETRTNPLLDFGDEIGGEYGGYWSSGSSYGSDDDVPALNASPLANKVYLSAGNTYTAQPGDEYLVLRNTSGGPVDITGWILTNGKGTRPIETSHNSYFYPTAESATIGQGTEFLDPSGRFVVSNIILKNGDTAYITTGKPYSQFPFSIYTSFRENICMGYLKNYPFEPRLNRNCPHPANDPQINSVTDECYDYIRSLGSCEDPTKYSSKWEKEEYDLLTSQCKNFMLVRTNYPSCVANNRYAKNFNSNIWRIFLGKDRELWRSERETITLYDRSGLIVAQIKY